METKVCTKCHRELPLDSFYLRGRNGGRRSECKECHSAYVKAKYQEKKNAVQEVKR